MTTRYRPQPFVERDNLLQYLKRELDRIGRVIDALQDDGYEATTVAPSRPRDGMVRLADGTAWNPGSGQGLYVYYNGAWHSLG